MLVGITLISWSSHGKPTKWALLEREARFIRINFQKTIHYACTPKLPIKTSPGGDTTFVKYQKKTTNNAK